MLNQGSEGRLADTFERMLSFPIPATDVLPGDGEDHDDLAMKELYADLRLAQQLKRINLSAESQARDQLRAQLSRKTHKPGEKQTRLGNALPLPRALAFAILSALLVLLLSANAPARAALSHLLGYGYLPYAGFVALADTRMIQGPVMQSDRSQTITVLQGIQTPQKTLLWIGANLDPSALRGAALVSPDGMRFPLRSLQANGETTVLVFDPLPEQAGQSELALPGGWQLPLNWIPADQAGLAPTRVSVPFAAADRSPCVEVIPGDLLCVRAAYTDAEGTHLLLQAYRAGQPVALLPDAGSEWQAILLVDEAGITYSFRRFEPAQEQDASILSLRFAPVRADVTIVTLRLPLEALIIGGNALEQPRIIELPLRLPERQPARSPTPGVAPSKPDRPVVIPTPGTAPPAFDQPNP